ncbi:hypothetical protein ACJJTC_005944 [Scirpophaga incertulas]
MKLYSVLFRRNLLPNGHIHRGKDRLVRPVEPKDLRKIREDFAIEEQNMLYLRYPYLSEAESCGHAKALGKSEMRLDAMMNIKRRFFKEDVTLFERLGHLRVSEGWD